MKSFQAILPSFVIFTCTLIGCKKEIETQIQIKEVDKKYSWSESTRFQGLQRIVLSLGATTDGLFIQQPTYFSSLVYQGNRLNYNSYLARMPSDVNIHIPINGRFYAAPERDSIVVLGSSLNPVSSFNSYIQLKQIDPTALRVANSFPEILKFGAINKNDYLLFSYENAAPGRPFTFILSQVQAPSVLGAAIKATSRRIVIPRNQQTSLFFRNITAIDDYFLVTIDGAGVYKIKQDGSFQLVSTQDGIDVFYKWKGRVYGMVEYNEIMVSDNDGISWNKYSGLPDFFNFTTYSVVSDSLIGVSHLLSSRNTIFSLRWNGLNYSARALKNDGLERVTITSLEQLRDSVYIGTTAGLFVRPVKAFFETKQ
jgi:hypothetical protein